MNNRDYYTDALLGLATGDALGVPVEFLPRKALDANPVTGMRAFGAHRQPAGTWSDDSSLTFCLAEMLCKGYDLNELARLFVAWKEDAYWTAHGEVFDIGIATSAAIYQLQQGVSPVLAGGDTEESNGNGSLMRILPLLFYIKDKPIEERFRIIEAVSALTPAYPVCIGLFYLPGTGPATCTGQRKIYGFRKHENRSQPFSRATPGLCAKGGQ